MFASMIDGIFACEGCGQTYPEYVNGCVKCWDDDASVEENRRRFPRRSVRLVVPETGRPRPTYPPAQNQENP